MSRFKGANQHSTVHSSLLQHELTERKLSLVVPYQASSLAATFRYWLLSAFAPCSFEISDPPQLDAAVPLHLHCPFTSGVRRVTLQGYETLRPLNDASTRCPHKKCNYIHIFHQMCVYQSCNEYFYCCKLDEWCDTLSQRADDFHIKYFFKNKSLRPSASITMMINIMLVFTVACVFLNGLKTQKSVLATKREQGGGWN